MTMTAVDVTPGTTAVWKQSQFSSRNIRTGDQALLYRQLLLIAMDKTLVYKCCNNVLRSARLPRQSIPLTAASLYSIRPYSTQKPSSGYRMVSNPPPNEMVYLPGILSPSRSFGVFRKVIHTGLYSQFVAMEVPVNGEIGDEV